MLTIINDALFLKAENKDFKGRDGNQVNYTKVTLLDGENNLIEATLDHNIDVSEIEPRTEGRAEVEITEQKGDKGTYLKKRLVNWS